MSRKVLAILMAFIVCLGGMTGCASVSPRSAASALATDPCDEAAHRKEQLWKTLGGGVIGGGIGAGFGALIDKLLGSKDHRYLKWMAVAGAGIGASYGYFETADLYRRQCELLKVAQRNQIEASFRSIELTEDEGESASSMGQPTFPILLASIESTGIPLPIQIAKNPATEKTARPQIIGGVMVLPGHSHFRVGSNELTPKARTYFAAIAGQYTLQSQENGLDQFIGEGLTSKLAGDKQTQIRDRWAELRIVLIGHTDDTGPAQVNAKLSEQRARAVADLFREYGIPNDRLYYQGAGSSFPIADNRTATGRAKNRRVEVAEAQGEDGVRKLIRYRQANPDYYRPEPEDDSTEAEPNTENRRAAKPSEVHEVAKTPSEASVAGSKQKLEQRIEKPDTTTATSGVDRVESKAAARASNGETDFGGKPAREAPLVLSSLIGPPKASTSSWGFVREAVAANDKLYDVPCNRDDPNRNVGLPMKMLRSDRAVNQTHKTSDYLPGLYGTSWTDYLNGHLVAFTNISVLRDGGFPASNPSFMVFKDFEANPSVGRKPNVEASTRVKTYMGTQGLLYRVFYETNSSPGCADIVFAYGRSLAAKGGSFIYAKDKELYAAQFLPRIAK